IPGVVPVNPEGGKLARAQATAPLWESGSIELPDPQHFGCAWVEDYLHNICTFPKAAHDDDVDATSQALIYMRSRLGGGIVEFYRMQATGEVSPRRSVTLSQNGRNQDCGSQVPGSPERAAFARAGVEVPSPAMGGLSGSALARNVLAAVAQGSQIHCNSKQYPEIRAALKEAVSRWSGSENDAHALWARSEIERLDLLFLNRIEQEQNSRTTLQVREAVDQKPAISPSDLVSA
ncbi:MAG TPA: phage terminase large subunit, partial [Candidatus Angelobacter sp.]|nr:phage terminase large subunit [Candidatus Angelobacter sp.]